jgi:hypothetical protein
LGFGVMLAGYMLANGGYRFTRGAADAFPLALLGALTMLLMNAALATVAEGFWIGLVLYGPYVLALVVWGR